MTDICKCEFCGAKHDWQSGLVWECDCCDCIFCTECAVREGGQIDHEREEVLCPDCAEI